MRLRWALVAVFVVAGCSDPVQPVPPAEAVVVTPALTPLSDADVVARAGAAVWRVATDGCDWLGSGSAFAVDDHHLVTNRHVIANDTSPTLISPSGDELAGKVIGASEAPDVAVIEVDAVLPVTLQWAPTDALRAGEHVVVLGYPAPELVFTTTVGSIVNFQGRDGTREAMLTDAPIAPGNSGGPGLRADATVAGVVTQMTLDDPTQRAAIVFSAADVEATVESFIADPDDGVLSDCGLGPDYVPPLPDHFDVPTPPPPPATTGTTLPLPLPTVPTPTVTTAPPASATSTTTTRPAPTTTTSTTEPPPCPDGGLDATVVAVSARGGEDDGTWYVFVTVDLTNAGDADIVPEDIGVTIGGQVGGLTLLDGLLRPGDTQRFKITMPEPVESVDEPDVTDATGTVTWRWDDVAPPACPHDPLVLIGS